MTNTTPATQEDELRAAIKEAGRAPIKWFIGQPIEYDSIDNDKQIDNLVLLIKSELEKAVTIAEEVAYERGHLAGYELGKSKATTEAYKSGYRDRGLEELGGKNG